MDENRQQNSAQINKKSKRNNNNNKNRNYIVRKRPSVKPEQGENIIYVNTKTNTRALLEICKRLILNKNVNEIIIYCLGAAIQRGILLALKICEEHVSFQIHTNTLTTQLLDDLEPTIDNEDYQIQRRNNSALRIRVFRTDLLLEKQQQQQQCSSQSTN